MLEYIQLVSLISTLIILGITCYFPLMNYYRRPKLVLEPHRWSPEQNVQLLGLVVRNLGRSIAKRVYGVIEFNSATTRSLDRICWNDSPNDQSDILPGPLNEYWFYIAKLEKDNRSIKRSIGCFNWRATAREFYEVTVKLFWDYHGLRSMIKKFSLNLSSWNELKITPIN